MTEPRKFDVQLDIIKCEAHGEEYDSEPAPRKRMKHGINKFEQVYVQHSVPHTKENGQGNHPKYTKLKRENEKEENNSVIQLECVTVKQEIHIEIETTDDSFEHTKLKQENEETDYDTDSCSDHDRETCGNGDERCKMLPSKENNPVNYEAPQLKISDWCVQRRSEPENQVTPSEPLPSTSGSPPPSRKAKTFLTIREKKILVNIYKYLEKSSPAYPSKMQFYKIISEIMDVSQQVVRDTVRNHTKNQLSAEPVEQPAHRAIINNLDEYTLFRIRQKVQGIVGTIGIDDKLPTVEKIMKAVNEDDSLPNFSLTTMYRILKKLNLSISTRSRKRIKCKDKPPVNNNLDKT